MTHYRIEKYSTRRFPLRRQYRFRIVAVRNGKIVAQGEGYYNKADRDNTVAGLKKDLGNALVLEV